MKVFSDKYEGIFLITINYKSGRQIQLWVSEFHFSDNNAEWKLTSSPQKREIIEQYVQEGCHEEKIFKEYINLTKSVIFLGVDNIESIYQEESCIVKKFDGEFIERMEEKIKEYVGK